MSRQPNAPAEAGVQRHTGGVSTPRLLPSQENSFAGSSSRLAGLAGALLGWRPWEFWAATPAELAAVFAAWRPAEAAPASAELLAELQERFPDG